MKVKQMTKKDFEISREYALQRVQNLYNMDIYTYDAGQESARRLSVIQTWADVTNQTFLAAQIEVKGKL
jgi:hypothetical protein